MESDETLLSSILSGLHQVAPDAVVDVARDVDEADRIAADNPVALFVLDLDAASEPNVVRDLRARHPKAQAIVLTSADAKSEGRQLPLRADWETAKFVVMEEVVRDKFTRNAELRQKLLDTGDAYLEEGNTWGDKIWGTVNGEGENRLGKILMKIREELRRK